MKRFAMAAALLLPAAVDAQLAPLTSGVMRWSAVTLSSESVPMANASTTPLASLNIRVESMPVGAKFRVSVNRDDEELLIVKEGRMRVTLGSGAPTVLGQGSVVVTLPGDRRAVANAGNVPVIWWRFTYRSKASMNLERGNAAGGSFMIDGNDIPVQQIETGARRNVFDRATAMFSRFEMHVSTLNEGLTNHAPHTHGAEEFVVMRHGDVQMTIGDTRPRATAGDLIFLASLVPHSLDNTGKGAAQYFAFQWQ